MFGTLCLLLVVFCKPADVLDDWWWRTHHPGSQRVATVETPYERIDLGQSAGQHTVFSNGLPATTLEDTENLTGGQRGADFYLSLHPAPRRILILGEGAPAMPERILDHSIVERVVYVLRDSGVLELIRSRQTGVWNDPRLSVVHTDGRRFLNETEERYDLVVFDLPPPVSAAGNRFFTVEAFRAVRGRLREGGQLVFALPSSAHFLAGENELLLASVYGALRATFDQTFLLAGESMVFGGGRSQPVLDELAARFARRSAPLRLAEGRRITDEATKQVVFTAIYEQLFEPFRWEMQTASLRNARISVNSDVEPLAYYLNLRRWAREGRIYGLDTFLAAAEHLRTATRAHGLMIVMGGAICAALYGVMARSKRLLRATVAGAVFTSGAAGMLGQLTLLFIYQNSYGRLYQTAGALFAVYMLGLAVGSAVSTKYGVYIANRTSALVLLRLPMLITCLLIIPLAVRPSQAALFSLLLTHALLVGVEYPLANRVYRSDLAGVRAVGVLHGMDHLGAAVAASVGGAVVLPLIGPQAMAGALAGVHLVVFVALAVSLANRRAAFCPSSRTAKIAR